ncbi:hypothetical protein Ahy_B07g087417 isoform A [Arachis hypogaea]|uniref:Alpha-1,3/1,6-mannosyltransferase ALG2 n=1 Tax=Arachis hypogaea TaxID=3818 RepID=A0A444YC40_ARAHY|nr:hypothetical protein Ahy_B07g087417 isoform A [Arachis hypogaea]
MSTVRLLTRRSSLITSCMVFLSLPLLFATCSPSISSTLLIGCSANLLPTCSNHLRRDSTIFSTIGAIPTLLYLHFLFCPYVSDRSSISASSSLPYVTNETYIAICIILYNILVLVLCCICCCRLNFLSINRFERKKNIELAISAFAMLHSPEASLTIAGGFDIRLKENVEYLEELKALAEREGVSNRIRFITSCSTTERNALLSECLCVIYTPKDEHFGIVPVEAMAAYKPVIACNSGGPLESVKNDETGFLCDPIPEEFSSAMAKFIKDPKEAERMGREARKHVVDSFSTHTFGQSLNRYIVDIHRGKED